MEGRRRLSLLEQMSAISNDLLTSLPNKPPSPAPDSISGRTLLDIIRDQEPKSYKALIGKKDKKPWKTFKDRLRLKPANNSSWVSSARVPTSDIHPVRSNHHPQGYSHSRPRRNFVTYVTPEPQPMAEHGENADNTTPAPTRIVRSGSNHSFARRSSVRLSAVDDVESPRRRRELALGEDRSMSAREAVAAQQAAEAAEAAAAAEENAEGEEGESSSENVSGGGIVTLPEAEPVRMSLMDLLEENDREMGLEGSRYMIDSDDEDEDEEEDEEEVKAEEEEEGGGVEHSCCVCMVRHKGAAFIPCGHTFCRTCSKELLAQRGNCPLCNNYILEILNIF